MEVSLPRAAAALFRSPGPRTAWRFETPEPINGAPGRAPQGHLYLCDGKTLYRLEPDGRLAWKIHNPRWTPFRPVALPDGGVVWSPGGRGLSYYHPDGRPGWTWGQEYESCCLRPTVVGDTLYGCFHRQGEPPRLVAVRQGRPTGSAPLPVRACLPPVPDGRGGFRVRSDDDRLLALDAQGKELWARRLPGRLNSGVSVGADGSAYLGNDRGEVFRVGPDGQVERLFRAGAAVRGAPVPAPGGGLYVTSQDGHLYALDASGQERWRFDARSILCGPVALLPDGTVLLGAEGRVVALDPEGQKLWEESMPATVEEPMLVEESTVLVVAGRHLAALAPRGAAALAAGPDDPPPAAGRIVAEGSHVTIGDVRLEVRRRP
jgi:outer membrane protein assembly factor BamB